MKRILLFLMILISFKSYTQHLYNVDLELYFWAHNNDRHRMCEAEYSLTLNYSDGSSEVVISNAGMYNITENKSIQVTKKPISVKLYARAKRRNTFGSCSGNEQTINNWLLSTKICTEAYSTYKAGSNATEIDGHVKVKITPSHTLSPEINSIQNSIPIYNTYLPSDDKINLFAKEGFDANLYHYQYSLDNTHWEDIDSSLYNLHKLSISAKDLFGKNYKQNLGKKVYFRVVSCLENGQYRSASSSIFLTLIESAPHLISTQVSPTKCFDSSDGSIKLNFDRFLLEDETLQLSLVNTTTGAAVLNQDISNELENKTSYTLTNIPEGNYRLDFRGSYKGQPTYTDATHTTSFEITKPLPITFNATAKEVYCFGGSDGEISLIANGGQGHFQYLITKNNTTFIDWTNFENGKSTLIKNLTAGTYVVKVRDTNGCIAKDPNNTSKEKEILLNITQPNKAITLSEIEIFTPTGYGLNNGYISVRVEGGTPKNDGSYEFQWRKDTPNGSIITSGITTDNIHNPFTIKLGDIPAGNYYLTIKDKNYHSASSELGHCGIISKAFIISQPEPLLVNIDTEKSISCHINNKHHYRLDINNNGVPDDAEDGTLKANVTGGVKPYSYQWQVLSNGSYQDITNATQDQLTHLSAGTYKVLIKDKNNNQTETTFTFDYPAELSISLFANTISCHNEKNGEVSVKANGGTGSYTYDWSTGHNTPIIRGLSADIYSVEVSDTNNCKVYGRTEILQPEGIVIEDIIVQNPICFGANNGRIKVKITGGKPPYQINWSNGASSEENTNLPKGLYTLTITDANGCSLSKDYTLTDPDALTIDLGQDITLCSGDTHTYDISIKDSLATYQWLDQNGTTIGTTPNITLSLAGTYTAIVTDSKGCQARDSVVIKNSSQVLNPQFMVTSYVYTDTNVILVNTSPTPPQSVEWIIPNDDNNIQIIDKNDNYLKLKFFNKGSYNIGLKGHQGECSKIFSKTIVVEDNLSGINIKPSKGSNILDFNILPNPNKGVFKVLINLHQEKSIKLRILDMLSHQVLPEVSRSKAKQFVVPYNAQLPVGKYLVILETADEVLVKRMMINP